MASNSAESASDTGPAECQSFTVIADQKLVSMLGAFKKVNIVTTYAEVLDGLRIYILEKKLFEPENPIVVHCKDDELGSILGVEVFRVPQIRKLLEKLVYPVRVNKNNNSAPVLPSSTTPMDSAAVKRKAEGAQGGIVKRSCEESSNGPMFLYVPPSPTKAGSSSDTAESIQGYETAFVKDTSDESFSIFEESDHELRPGDILAVEETFDVEYEIESDIEDDTNIYVTDSGSDSETADGTVITFICKSDSDQEFWADKSSDEEYGSDVEIPESDKWRCKRCNSLNNPPMRYCIKCWCLRTGWIAPKRSEQRAPTRRKLRKRHSKKSESALDVVREESSSSPKPPTSSSTDHSLQELPIISSSDLSNSQDFLLSEPSSQEFISSSLSSGYISKVHYSSSDTSSCSQDLSSASYSSSQEFQSTSPSNSSVEYPSTSYGDSDKYSNDMIHSLNNFRTLNLSTVKKCDSEAKMCLICCSRPANASIIHGKYAHQISCYKCARKLQLGNKRCPVCRRTIDRVVHQITGI